MLKYFPALIVWLSLFSFTAVAQVKKCSLDPDRSLAVVDSTHKITSLSDPGTMILSWKLGSVPEVGTYNFSGLGIHATYDSLMLPKYSINISTLGIGGTNESVAKMQTEGYTTTYYSLRMSTMQITKVTQDLARPFYCFFLDNVENRTRYCESKLNVLASPPFFDSTGINLTARIVTNITCSISFTGSAYLNMEILDSKGVWRTRASQNFTSFGNHSQHLVHDREATLVNISGGLYTVSPDQNIQSNYSCKIRFDEGHLYQETLHCYVDAPVSNVTIAPQNATRCTLRKCYMHEKLTCISDGKPKPDMFFWRIAINHEQFRPMDGQTRDQYALVSGRSTFECRVYNDMGGLRFTAARRFTTHVEAFEWKLDEYASYAAKGNKHRVWYPVTIHATVTGIIFVFLHCYRF